MIKESKCISVNDAIKTAWMILGGLGYAFDENPQLEKTVQTVFETAPAADVRPVVRGMWTKELHPNVRYNQYKCSVCGKFSGHDEEGWIWKPNFCPNCGADMREES